MIFISEFTLKFQNSDFFPSIFDFLFAQNYDFFSHISDLLLRNLTFFFSEFNSKILKKKSQPIFPPSGPYPLPYHHHHYDQYEILRSNINRSISSPSLMEKYQETSAPPGVNTVSPTKVLND